MGMNAAMTMQDSISASYRCHCLALLRGKTVEQVLAELFGFSQGATKGKGGSMHYYWLVVGVCVCVCGGGLIMLCLY